MEIAEQLLVLFHLIGFASLFGGFLVQLRSAEPEINAAMLYGAWTQAVTGILLVGLIEMGDTPLNYVKLAVKLLISLLILLLVAKNRRFESIPKGLATLIGAMTLANAAIAVVWQ